MSYSAAEVKSGLFVSITLILLLTLTFLVGNFMGGSTQTWQIRFTYVGGIKQDAPVYFSGVEVGKIDKIEVQGDKTRPMLMTVRISSNVVLREDSQVFVDSLGLMGEKCLELTPGTAGSSPLKAGTEIQGTDPIAMYEMVQKMYLLVDRTDELLISLNPMVKTLNNVISDKDEAIAKTIANLEESSANIRDMTNDLKYHPWKLLRK